MPQGKGGNHSAQGVLGCRLRAGEQPQGTKFFGVKNRRGLGAERPSGRIPFRAVEENRVQRGQALGPTAHGKALYGLAPACSHSLPHPIPQPACWVFLLMLEWATLGPGSGPLHLLFTLPRMPSAHLRPPISMSGSFCQVSIQMSPQRGLP